MDNKNSKNEPSLYSINNKTYMNKTSNKMIKPKISTNVIDKAEQIKKVKKYKSTRDIQVFQSMENTLISTKSSKNINFIKRNSSLYGKSQKNHNDYSDYNDYKENKDNKDNNYLQGNLLYKYYILNLNKHKLIYLIKSY